MKIIQRPWNFPRSALPPRPTNENEIWYKRDIESGEYTVYYQSDEDLKQSLKIVAQAKGVSWESQTPADH